MRQLELPPDTENELFTNYEPFKMPIYKRVSLAVLWWVNHVILWLRYHKTPCWNCDYNIGFVRAKKNWVGCHMGSSVVATHRVDFETHLTCDPKDIPIPKECAFRIEVPF